MDTSFGRYLLVATIAAGLDGCGAQTLDAPGSLPQAPSVSGVRVKQATSGQALLYVSDYAAGNVYAYTYPQGKLASTLTGFIYPHGECVDSAGDLFVVSWHSASSAAPSVITEYAHGGTSPIATLSDPTGGVGCSVDPNSGNLAVAGWYLTSGGAPYGDVAVFAKAQGTPTMYYSSTLEPFQMCGYDASGNLYISGDSGVRANEYLLVRLSNGSSNFEQMTLNHTLYGSITYPPSVQWDGKHMTVSSGSAGEANPSYVYQLSVSGDSAKTVARSTLKTVRGKERTGEIAIYDGHVISSYYQGGAGGIDLWAYPKARKGTVLVHKTPQAYPFGIGVSPPASYGGSSLL